MTKAKAKLKVKVNPDAWNEVWMDYGSDAMRTTNLILKRTAFLERVPKDAKILDVGCGTGVFLRELKKLGYTDLHGLEPDPQLFERDDLGGIIQEGDALTFGAKKAHQGRYDVVVITGVLHHLKDYGQVQRCLRNIHAVLKPGGTFYTLEPWKHLIRSIMQYLVRDTFVGYIIFRKDKILLKLEERELGQWLEMEKDVTAYAPTVGLHQIYGKKDLRYRYLIFQKTPKRV